jgi:hypothetical protein
MKGSHSPQHQLNLFMKMCRVRFRCLLKCDGIVFHAQRKSLALIVDFVFVLELRMAMSRV